MKLQPKLEAVVHRSPSISSQDGDTALMIASSSGHSSVVEMLLPAGATVNATNEVKYPVGMYV